MSDIESRVERQRQLITRLREAAAEDAREREAMIRHEAEVLKGLMAEQHTELVAEARRAAGRCVCCGAPGPAR